MDHELALLVLKKRVVKSSQDIEMVSPLEEIQLLVESHADDGDAEEAVTKIQQQTRKASNSIGVGLGPTTEVGALQQDCMSLEDLVVTAGSVDVDVGAS